MELRSNRRRFLQTAGASLTLSIAGCSAPAPSDGQAATGEQSEGAVTVTLALEIDQKPLQEKQNSLTEQLQNGSLNQTEARQQLYAAEQELLGEAAAAFEDRIASDERLSVAENAEEMGVLLVTGSAEGLIQTLGYPEVRGLLPEAAFEDALAQADGGQ
ncbi:MAG: hypothetical protein ACQEQJ_02565 [Halobacteriota archaeon]